MLVKAIKTQKDCEKKTQNKETKTQKEATKTLKKPSRNATKKVGKNCPKTTRETGDKNGEINCQIFSKATTTPN